MGVYEASIYIISTLYLVGGKGAYLICTTSHLMRYIIRYSAENALFRKAFSPPIRNHFP